MTASQLFIQAIRTSNSINQIENKLKKIESDITSYTNYVKENKSNLDGWNKLYFYKIELREANQDLENQKIELAKLEKDLSFLFEGIEEIKFSVNFYEGSDRQEEWYDIERKFHNSAYPGDRDRFTLEISRVKL